MYLLIFVCFKRFIFHCFHNNLYLVLWEQLLYLAQRNLFLDKNSFNLEEEIMRPEIRPE